MIISLLAQAVVELTPESVTIGGVTLLSGGLLIKLTWAISGIHREVSAAVTAAKKTLQSHVEHIVEEKRHHRAVEDEMRVQTHLLRSLAGAPDLIHTDRTPVRSPEFAHPPTPIVPRVMSSGSESSQ